MSFEINVDKYAFAQTPEPEKRDENYSTVLAKRLITEESKQREEQIAALEQSVQNESYARTDADVELKGQIDSEVLTRSAEISALDAKLGVEKDARILKDDELGARLTEETKQRATADASFLQAIDSLEYNMSIEMAQRKASYNELSSRLELKANATDVHTKSYIDQNLSGLIKDITAEQNARNAADNDLALQINQKANAQDVYTKGYLDTAFSEKCDNTRVDEVEQEVDEVEQEVRRLDRVKEEKTVILTNYDDTDFTFNVLQMYGGECRCNLKLTSLSLEFDDGEYPDDYISALSFDCGEGLTEVVYPASQIIAWLGTDCVTTESYSIFQPAVDTHYDVVFYFNGAQFIALVNGYPMPLGNEAE